MKNKKHDTRNQLAEDTGGISVREAGARGGRSTLERHGVKFYHQIGAQGGQTTKKRYAHLFSEFGRKGGRPRRPALNDEGAGERDQ